MGGIVTPSNHYPRYNFHMPLLEEYIKVRAGAQELRFIAPMTFKRLQYDMYNVEDDSILSELEINFETREVFVSIYMLQIIFVLKGILLLIIVPVL